MDKKIIKEYQSFLNPAKFESFKINSDVCRLCSEKGFTCCECLPCYFSPTDIKDLSYEGLKKFIDTGLISIDWYDGEPDNEYEELQEERQFYFLRMRGKFGKIVHPAAILTECILYNKESGCPLKFEYRAKCARDLIPVPEHDEKRPCNSLYTKQMCAIEWIPYLDTLEQLSDYYISIGERSSKADDLISALDALNKMSNALDREDERQGKKVYSWI